ncbi:MAG: hypothetical protein V9G08_13245 [Dermatophilaceae bacterium]
MSSPGHGHTRAARAALLALVVVALAVAGHRLGGGSGPALPVLIALWAALAAPSLALARRRLRWPMLLLVLGAGQTALHLTFGALSAPTLPVTVGMPSGHDHGTLHGIPAAVDGASMPLAHLAATLATAVLLAWGERALWALWERVRPRPLPAAATLHRTPRRPLGVGPLQVVGAGAPAGLPLGRAPPGRS